MKKLFAVLAVAAVAVVGCGDDDDGGVGGSPKPLAIGETFRGPHATYAITGIEVDPRCEDSPSRGHLVAVQMTVETDADADKMKVILQPTSSNFSTVDRDGFTVEADTSTYYCYQREGFDQLDPGSKFRGWVFLDVPEPSGELLFRFQGQNLLDGGSVGPGWSIPYAAIPRPPQGPPPPVNDCPEGFFC